MNKDQPFVHLHVHTKYSLLDGACHIHDLVKTAAEHNMPAMAITDHGVMYGAIDFYKQMNDAGIKPIIGCETYTTPGSRFDRKSDRQNRAPINHLVLLASNLTGYHNLMKLVSLAHLEGFYYKPRIDREILSKYSEGLIGLSACLQGEVACAIKDGDTENAIDIAGELSDILGKGRFFLEVMDHNLAEQRKVNMVLKEVSKRTAIPLVATNDVHYLKKEHAEAHEVLMCLQTQTVLSDPTHMRHETNEFYLKSRAEMEPLFSEFEGALDRTLEIAGMCSLELDFNTLHFPKFTVPEGKTQKQYLTELALDGIKRLYGIKAPKKPANKTEQEIIDRFKMELSIIEETGFINYFLVVWDFVRFAREQHISVGPGRGSGGGSILAYALGITTIDPLHYDLVFERFLNPQRVSPPDFDIDFCQSRRGEVIEYVKEKYGRENVAQIITFGSLGPKSVIRDVGRVLEIPYGECDRLSKMVPEGPEVTLDKALKQSQEFQNEYEKNEDCKRILDYAFVLEGLYRNPGTHAAGVVISEKPLMDIIPLARDKDKQTITQFTMEPLQKIGLLKMDFLGLKTLTVIQEAVDLIKQHRSLDIDIENIPLDDRKTYELLSNGDTIGVFQLESSGMRDLVRRVGMNRIEDLIAMIALYRPGPMNMLDDYIARKSGQKPVHYDHPLMEPILEETYGVMVYQEQVQKCANVLAGYSLGDADILRRAMGKKKRSEMKAQQTKFVEGCRETNNIKSSKAKQIFDRMAEFAGYGFNKAHSTGYAIISYQTAYLKANYPAEFMAALLSSEMGNADKLPVFISEAREMGLEIRPPDVNSSSARFVPDGNAILFGLAGIKNVGEGAADALVREREGNGNYKSLIDFCSRVDGQTANRKVLESLARCGAFDSLGFHRARLFNGIDFAMTRAAGLIQDKQTGQGSLFDLMDEDTEGENEEIPDCPEWHENELLSAERELLGIYMSGHPLTQHEYVLEHYQLSTLEALSQLPDGTDTRVGGIIAQARKAYSKSDNKPMAFVQLEGLDGAVEVVVWSDVYQLYGSLVNEDAAVLICGALTHREGTLKITANEIYPLEDAPRYFARRLALHVPETSLDNGKLERIRDILALHPGTTPVIICLIVPSGEKIFLDTNRKFSVLPTKKLVRELEHELGEKGVYVEISPKPYRKEPLKRKWQRNST